MDLDVAVRELAERVRAASGRALVVGGAVRDRLAGLAIMDVDVEVFGVPAEHIAGLARTLGEVHEIGKAFGVLEVRISEPKPAEALAQAGGVLHISLPRRESKIAPGHRGFAVDTDPAMSPVEAARRRDFTINAMAEDPLTGEILDPFDGRNDLARRILRVVDPRHFGEDPLRVLRGAVFAAQFELQVDPDSAAVIRAAVPSMRELPKERIGEEWKKLLSRPKRPSVGLTLLMEWGVFALLHPEFVPLPQTFENTRWHPEGNTWAHTMMAVDEAAKIIRSSSLRGASATKQSPSNAEIASLPSVAHNDEWKLYLMLATLCHDLGKATMTKQTDDEWKSPEHNVAGVEPTRRFLTSIAADHRTTDVVTRLVREHLAPLQFFRAKAAGQPPTDGAVRTLARRLQPATIALLTFLAEADIRGRGPAAEEYASVSRGAGEQLRQQAERIGVLRGPPAPVLTGADLIALGLTPGPAFGKILARAEELSDTSLSRDDMLSRLRGAHTAEEALPRLH